MKKSLIATGAASLALAAMPVVGVFAEAVESNTVTDHITVNIPASCTIQNANYVEDGTKPDLENWYYREIPNGQYQVINGANTDPDHPALHDNGFQVTCNDQTATGGSWKLTAVGAGDTGYETKLHLQGAADGTKDISSAAAPVTSATGLPATSDWSFAVTLGNGITPGVNDSQNFVSGQYYQIPASEMNIASGTGSTAADSFTTSYGVYVSPTQQTGTYKGAVKYTLYNPAA